MSFPATRQNALLAGICSLLFGFYPAQGATPLTKASPSPAGRAAGYVELHSHLFMAHGLWPLVRDPFHESPKSEAYLDRFRSRATAKSLETTDADIVVASLYVHPWLNRSPRESVLRQIQEAQRFIEKNPRWLLARTSSEARKGLRDGKKILVLHLEGASEILEREEDFHTFLDQGGIRIVTPLHLTDDAFGGGAFLPAIHALSNPVALLSSWIRQPFGGASFSPETPSVRQNPRGLTPLGEDLIRALLRRRIWVDLAHASDAALTKILPLLREAKQPFLHTHTALRTEIEAERGLTLAHLREVEASGGMIGLMPTEQMLGERMVPQELCQYSCDKEHCARDIGAFAREWREARQILSPGALSIGSDHQGGVPGLKPACGSGTSLDRAGRGYTQMNQTAELFEILHRLGVRGPEDGALGIERFLGAWAKVESSAP